MHAVGEPEPATRCRTPQAQHEWERHYRRRELRTRGKRAGWWRARDLARPHAARVDGHGDSVGCVPLWGAWELWHATLRVAFKLLSGLHRQPAPANKLTQLLPVTEFWPVRGGVGKLDVMIGRQSADFGPSGIESSQLANRSVRGGSVRVERAAHILLCSTGCGAPVDGQDGNSGTVEST